MIDDVRIYARALSAAEIATDMNTAVFLDHPPTANISATPLSGIAPLTVNFDGTGSSDPDPGDPLTYAWDLDNDGLYDDSTSPTPQYTFTTGGSKTVRLLVTDSHGQSATASKIINVNTAPTMFIDAPVIGVTWKVGDTINFLGHATDNEDGALAASAITWQLILHHGATTQVLQTFTAVDNGHFTAPDQPYPCYLELAATATDSLGAQTTSSVVLDPQAVKLNFVTVPAGLSVTVNGSGGITPFSRTVIVGSENGIDASSDQIVGTTTYSLANWSDGGAAAHAIVAPQDDTTYVARFSSVTVINGTSGDDNIQLTLIAPDQLQFQINSDPALIVYLGLGNSLIIDGGLGTDSLVVTDAVGNAGVSIDAASISMGSAFLASYTSIERTAFGGTGAPDALAVTGTEVALACNLTLTNLTAGAGGQLDVLDKSLTLNYVGSSPLSQVLALIQAGRSSGVLSGGTASILTSLGDSVHFTLGVAEDTATHRVTVKYTRYGDANLDGMVDTSDLLVLATNWLQSGRIFQTGDFNYDGTVDNADLGLLGANWQLSVTSPGSALPSSLVPLALLPTAPQTPPPPARRAPVRATSATQLVSSALK
jgi:PKD repeat protein